MHLRQTINMVVLHSGNRNAVVSMDSQVETVPGPQPQRGPPPATGVSDPEHVAGKGQSRVTGYNLNICHWNAEGVRNKKLTYSPAHSISKQGSRYGPLVCPSKPSSGGLQRICS